MIFIKSVWQDKARFSEFPRLCTERRTSVAVVGGGIAGLLTAYLLHREGVDCILVESRRICRGTTAGTTGKITSGHGLIYSKLINTEGRYTAEGYYRANKLACDEIKKIADRIDCDLEIKDNFIYSRDDRAAIEREMNALEKIGARAELSSTSRLPFETVGAVRYPDEAQFNPLKLLSAISKKLDIYEESPALEINGNEVVTPNGKILAERIVVATHFPIIDRYGAYFLKLYQSRSQVMALERGGDVGGMYMDGNTKGISLRNYGELLLVSGGARRTGKSGGKEELGDFVKKYYPNASIKYQWSAQDCMSLDGIPYIGEYSSSKSRLYVTAGFNKWGISSSMAGAMLLTDMIVGRKNPYADIFRPDRSILKPQLLLNVGETLMNFLCPKLKRCSHLGCALKWDPAEHTWDCPCHGSRFDEDGKVIEAPATKDINANHKKADG